MFIFLIKYKNTKIIYVEEINYVFLIYNNMRYIKKFEKYYKLQIGDYVICEWYDGKYNDKYKQYNDFLKNNVGQLIEITDKLFPGQTFYIIQYNNIPFELDKFKSSRNKSSFTMKSRDIIYYSKDKEELELKLIAKKFNI